MVILFDAIQFVETALVFSSFLFCIIMFVRTNDKLTGRTLMVLAPVAVLLFISYMFSLHNSDLNTGGSISTGCLRCLRCWSSRW